MYCAQKEKCTLKVIKICQKEGSLMGSQWPNQGQFEHQNNDSNTIFHLTKENPWIHTNTKKGKFLFTVKSQLINVDAMMELKKSLFENHQMIADSDTNHQQILKTSGWKFAGHTYNLQVSHMIYLHTY